MNNQTKQQEGKMSEEFVSGYKIEREVRVSIEHHFFKDARLCKFLGGDIERHVYTYRFDIRDEGKTYPPENKYEFFVVDGRRFATLESAKRAVRIKRIIESIEGDDLKVRVRRWQKGGKDIFDENMTTLEAEMLLAIEEQKDRGNNPVYVTGVEIVFPEGEAICSGLSICSAADMAGIKGKGELKQIGFLKALLRAYAKLS